MRTYIITLLLLFSLTSIAQTTFYSSNSTSGGDWNLNTSWTLSSDGSGAAAGPPGQMDHIVILSGHTILVDNEGDNGAAATSAATEFTVGAFPGNGTTRFYQTGDITVESGGVLSITDNTGAMFSGRVIVRGNITSAATGTDDDIVVAAYMELESGATMNVGDDLILVDNAEVVLDNNSVSADDIYMDGTIAQICGIGDLTIGGAIQEFNGADANQQMCDVFVVNCNDGDCCDDGTTVTSCAGNGDDGTFGGSGGFVLPVELVSFELLRTDQGISLRWRTSSEINNDYFTLEKSLDAEHFDQIGNIKGNGTTSAISSYQFTDPSGNVETAYYRLSQTDFDGTHEILDVLFSSSFLDPTIELYPNPATNYVEVRADIPIQLELLTLDGKRSIQKFYEDSNTLSLEHLDNGIYFLQVSFDGQPIAIKKLVINR